MWEVLKERFQVRIARDVRCQFIEEKNGRFTVLGWDLARCILVLLFLVFLLQKGDKALMFRNDILTDNEIGVETN